MLHVQCTCLLLPLSSLCIYIQCILELALNTITLWMSYHITMYIHHPRFKNVRVLQTFDPNGTTDYYVRKVKEDRNPHFFGAGDQHKIHNVKHIHVHTHSHGWIHYKLMACNYVGHLLYIPFLYFSHCEQVTLHM